MPSSYDTIQDQAIEDLRRRIQENVQHLIGIATELRARLDKLEKTRPPQEAKKK